MVTTCHVQYCMSLCVCRDSVIESFLNVFNLSLAFSNYSHVLHIPVKTHCAPLSGLVSKASVVPEIKVRNNKNFKPEPSALMSEAQH